MELFDVAIIGSGPAGISAAIYTARGQLKTLIFGNPAKSNLSKSHVIANYLGFPAATTGPELSELGMKQAASFGATHVPAEIIDLKINDDQTFTLKDNTTREYSARTVILATGQSYTLSGIKNEKEFTGKGVSYCVTCDGFFFKNKAVAVIGNGDFAGEEALELQPYTKNITILSHGKDFNFSEEISSALKKTEVKLVKTARLKELTGTIGAEKIISTDGTVMAFEGYFMAIGVAGASAFAKKLGIEMEGSYIKTDKDGKTSIPGIFAAGDCTGSAPQVAVSVGNGCAAGLSAIKLVRGLSVYIQYN